MAKRYTPPSEKVRLIKRQHGLCGKCKEGLILGQYEIDHRQPLSRGGTDTFDNKWLLCTSCHSKKTFHPRSKATTLGSDVFESAKTKRIIRKSTCQPKRQSIRSRGFQKNLTRKLDGSVIPRKS